MFKLIKINGARTNVPEPITFNASSDQTYLAGALYFLSECMTTMSRMVEEQRTQIGILKAIGYSEASIMGKFMFYSCSAALIGCVLGFAVGLLGSVVAPGVVVGLLGSVAAPGVVAGVLGSVAAPGVVAGVLGTVGVVARTGISLPFSIT